VRRWGWLGTATFLLLCVGSQILVHSAVTGAQPAWIGLALTLLPLLVLACWVIACARNKPLWLVVLFAAGAATYLLVGRDVWGLAAAYGIPHAAIYVFLLWLFGHTLLPGQEPLITRLARRVHGVLQPDLETYTRRLTAAWCGFFSAQLAISALLFELASPGTWSVFINLMNFPLLALMFAGEYWYRVTRHPDFPRASIATAIQAFMQDARPRATPVCDSELP
jgi:uncharacterized membrane protein